MKSWCLGGWLLLLAYIDGKWRYVDMRILGLQTVCGLCLSDFSEMHGGVWIIRLLPGLMLLCIAGLFHEKIGAGDGWLFLSLSVYMTAIEQLFLLAGALFLAVLWIVLGFLRHHVEKEIPLVPFVCVMYVGGVWNGWF